MFKKSKIKLFHLFLAGISFILLITVFLLGWASFHSIDRLGKYTIEKNKDFLKNEFATIITNNTENFASTFSSSFKEIFDCGYLLARNVEDLANNKNINPGFKDTLTNIQYFKKANLYTHITSPPVATVCYFGKNKISVKTWNFIRSILPIRNFLIKMNKIIPYSTLAWVSFFDKHFTIFSGDIVDKLALLPHNTLQVYLADLQKRLLKEYSNRYTIKNYSEWGYWTLPFIDFTNNQKAVAVKFPIFGQNGKLVGFSGIYIDLESIIKNSIKPILLYGDSSNSIFNKDFSIILSENTQIIYAPNNLYKLLSLPKPDMTLPPPYKFSMPSLIDSSNHEISSLAKEIGKNSSGCRTLELFGQFYIISYSKIKTNNWICVKVYPLQTATQFIQKTENKTEKEIKDLGFYFILISLICLLGSIIMAGIFFTFFIHLPIMKLCKNVKKFYNGNFENKIKQNGIAELQVLANSYNELGTSLKDYMENLKQEVSARQSFETEISIAAEIQKSITPKNSEVADRKEFELAGRLKPAKNVAGDFYDFFFLNDNKLVMIIADVSGKGISAAFFMTTAKVVLESACYRYDSTSDILEKANKYLTHNNESNLFVTTFICIYDTITGELSYSNAGHHGAALIKKNGEICEFGEQEKPPLGFFSNSKYISETRHINIDEILVLYTDGVTEAYNKQKNEFLGKENFFEIIKNIPKDTLDSFVRKALDKATHFQNDILFDDLTILTFKRKQ